MSWKLSTMGKIRALGALAVVFLLVLATNMMDKHHFQVVKRSLATVYEDRLVVKNNLYKVSRQLEAKQKVLQSEDKEQIAAFNKVANDSIESLISKFNPSSLTALESKHLKSLQNDLDRLYELEKEIPSVSDDAEAIDLATEAETAVLIKNHYASIANDIDALFQIQLDEGRRIIAISNRAVEKSDLISQLEIGALIVIGLLIQFLILVKPLKN